MSTLAAENTFLNIAGIVQYEMIVNNAQDSNTLD